MDISLVTCVGGSYSRFVGEWADRVAAQTVKPARVVLVDNGADDPDAVQAAARRLGGEYVRLPLTVNWGRARNAAVARASTEWVAHVDCDDLLFPFALEETQEVLSRHPEADVVQWGWRQTASGKTTVRQYRPLDGAQALRAGAKASGLSPFRRRLWVAAPYDDAMEGAWDTGLWYGFAWQGAKFRPTKKAVFEYRWHESSTLNSRLVDLPKRHRVGEYLRRLGERPMREAVVVMPWRDSGDADRRRAMQWCTRRWEAYGFEVVHAPDDDGNDRWNLSQARNNGVRSEVALEARSLIIADADVMVDRETAWEAVRLSHEHPWVVPHGMVHRMDGRSSERLFGVADDADLPAPAGTIRQPYQGYAGGGLIVITPGQYWRAGGYDERFRGWGCEDEAFGAAASTLIGKPHRFDRPLWHLYHHPGQRQKTKGYEANRRLLDRYLSVAGQPVPMKELVGSTGEPDQGYTLPARFRSRYKNHVVMMPSGRRLKFDDHVFVARDDASAGWLMYGADAVTLES
jgi:glycosyltransferase involved in cell wall biosynthesis